MAGVTKESARPTSAPWSGIRPPRGGLDFGLRELWAYRELAGFLVWRDLKVRYKQTVLGAAWAILQPFFTMLIFSLFFGRLAQIPSDGLPYPIFVFAALVPWTFFANTLLQSSNSLLDNVDLIKKVYFPRLVMPLASVLSGLVDFFIAFTVLLGMMAFYGVWPTPQILCVPLLLLLAVITSLGMGLWLSALNAQFRDVRYTLPFLTQIWMFATPVAYPSSLLPEAWRALYGLNPMAGVVEGFRWALLGADTSPGGMILVSAAGSLLLLATGALYFRRVERSFADVM